MDPTLYESTNDVQNAGVSYILSEFADDLRKMFGKCMDIGCGPGNVTKNMLLPALDANTKLIGKGEITQR